MKPTKDGKYRMKLPGEDAARVVSIELANDRIWDHDQSCMRSLISMLRIGATFEPVEGD